MATAFREFGGVSARRLHLANPALSAVETGALECIDRIARQHREATQEEITAAIGYSNGNMATTVINRLIAKGYVERVGGPYQKSMWLRVVATGQATAEPSNKTLHWKHRTDRVPAPAIQSVVEKDKPLASLIDAEARALGLPLTVFLADLVYIGWHGYLAEKEA